MRKKGLGFICIGHSGRFYFFDKDKGKITFTPSIGKAEYLPRKVLRLRKKFPLDQQLREKLINKHNLLTQKM